MPDIRLAMLPDRTPVKLTVSVQPELAAALQDYAAFYEQAYGQAEPVAELIPFMLSSFLESDRAFIRRRTGRS